MDVHLEVDSFLSVSEGHEIALEVRSKLLQSVTALTDAIIHVDVEDDLVDASEWETRRMPERAVIIREIREIMARHPERVQSIVQLYSMMSHYTLEGVVVDLTASLKEPGTLEQARTALQIVSDELQASSLGIQRVRTSVHVRDTEDGILAA
jgi:divalent metal cation (Fe/Co/Zn/Cd) transporter